MGNFKFLYAVQLERATASCQNCGHAIAQCFYLHHPESGKTIVVGCECVVHLLANEQIADFERNRKRMNRAASQWRKQEPKALEGETRTDYINRRVKEMGNALRAHKDWIAFNRPVNLWQRVYNDMCKEFGDPSRHQVWNHTRGNYIYDQWAYDQREAIQKWWDTERLARMTKISQDFAAKYEANPYDFNRASWDVRKV